MIAPVSVPFGVFGKIPAHADFVHRELPQTFVTPWDQWLSESLNASREALGEAWMPVYLKSPPWRFALDAGLAGPYPWMGVLLSSIDHVRRCYPLTLAVALPEAVAIGRLRLDFDPLLDRLEEIALALVAGERPLEGVAEAISPIAREIDRKARSAPLLLRWGDARATVCVDPPRAAPISAMLAEDAARTFDKGASCWWHHGWGDRGAARVVAEGLPPSAGFAAFLDAAWAAHGWIANA